MEVIFCVGEQDCLFIPYWQYMAIIISAIVGMVIVFLGIVLGCLMLAEKYASKS